MTQYADQTVELTIESGVAYVSLIREKQRNALNLNMIKALVEIGEQLRSSAGLSAVVLRGQGEDFCAGIDTGMFTSLESAQQQIGELLQAFPGEMGNLVQHVCLLWRQLEVPVIALLQGNVFGAGLQLALGADLRFASASTRVSLMEGRWGLIPDMGITQTGLGLIRSDLLQEMTWTARILEAEEARQAGLITRIVDDPEAALSAFLEQISQRQPHAIAAAKQLYRQAPHLAPAQALALEQSLQEQMLSVMMKAAAGAD